jgi:acid phosphatase family membrane protein YuiD
MRDIPATAPGGTAVDRGLLGVLTNSTLIAALLSCLVAQLAKVFTHYHSTKNWDWSRSYGSGGMPSSHTAFVAGLTTSIGFQSGTSSNAFALALVLTLIVAYDATGVRLHAGKHASLLTVIIAELPTDHPALDHPHVNELRESLGHTPAEVAAGALVGVAVGYLSQLLSGTARAVSAAGPM